MEQFILIMHLIIAVLLIVLVLIQQGKGAQTSSFGGVSKTLFGSVGSSGFLYRTTIILGITFFITSMVLVYLGKVKEQRDPLADLDMAGAAAVLEFPESKVSPVEKEFKKIDEHLKALDKEKKILDKKNK